MDETRISSTTRRSIKLYYDIDNISVNDFVNIPLGIEEEGIPYEVQGEQSSSVLDLAHRASVDSRLGVGIGISKKVLRCSTRRLTKRNLCSELNYIRSISIAT